MYLLLHTHEAADHSWPIACSEHLDRLKDHKAVDNRRSAWMARAIAGSSAPLDWVANGPTHEEAYRITWVEIV
jgi:hypothetical protein